MYSGWFHYLHLNKLGLRKRADEMFLMIGRELMDEILSRKYCRHSSRKICDELNQLFDTDYGGSSLSVWLSELNVTTLPLNGHTCKKLF